jgi:4-hydroxymandelate oxidase
MRTTRRGAFKTAFGLAATGLASIRPRNQRTLADLPAARATPTTLASLSDFEPAARDRLSHMAYEYISGGAGDEITVRANREAYERIRLRPRVLVDVSKIDTRVTLFGVELPFPILLAPTAYHRLVHPDGELATVRGAEAAHAAMVISSFATTSVERIAAETRTPLWFQLYVMPDRGFTRELVERAEAAGCRALCVTVDSPTPGARNREERAGFTLPPGMARENLRRLGATVAGGSHRPTEQDIFTATLDPALAWKDIEWLRTFARVPVLLKGIMNPEDAARGIETGASGLIVSNHGGRNLDTLPATVDALPAIVEKAAGRVPVLVDGGVRRGTDVLKAIALGASAVLIGRPYLYGLGVNGAEGVATVVQILRRELGMAMALTGRKSLAEIDRSVLWPSAC